MLWNILGEMLYKSNSNAEKNAEPGREENFVIHFGDLSRRDSVWEKKTENWVGEFGGVGRETFQRFQSFSVVFLRL